MKYDELERKLWEELDEENKLQLSDDSIEKAHRYLLFYSLQDSNNAKNAENINEDVIKIKRQIEVYEKLLKYKNDSAILNLINMTQTEIDRQYGRKNQFENRAVFLLAIWGILIGMIIGEDYGIIKPDNNHLSLLVWLLIIGGAVLVFICITLSPVKIFTFDLTDRENNYNSVVEDKAVYLVSMLESLTNAYEKNERKIKLKSRTYMISMILIVIWIICIASFYLMVNVFG